MAIGEQAETGFAVSIGQFTENLREVGGMLLLQQVQQIGGRADAQEASDGVEDEVDSARRRHGEGSSGHKRLTVARPQATLDATGLISARVRRDPRESPFRVATLTAPRVS